MSNKLTSVGALAYQGTNAPSPSNVTTHYNRPTSNFYQGFEIGDFWVYRVSPTSNANELWVLMGKAANVANWVLLSNSTGALLGLTANTGGFVGPTLGNINVVGDAVGISIAGNPGSSTLTASLVGGGIAAQSFVEDSGSAVPSASGVLNVLGGTGIATSGAGNTVTIDASGDVATLYTEDSGTATPAANNLNILGGTGISTTGSGSTVTIDASGDVATTYHTDSGDAIPALNILNIVGAGGISTSGAGNTVTITGPSGTVTTLHTQDGNNVTATAGVINVSGAYGITTTGTAGPNTATFNGPAKQAAFFAYQSSNVTNITGDGTNVFIGFDTVTVNNGGCYNAATGVFTAPVTGMYCFTATAQLIGIGAGHTFGYISIGPDGGSVPAYNIAVQSGFCSPLACQNGSNEYGLVGAVAAYPMVAGQGFGILIGVAGGAKTVGVKGTIGAGTLAGTTFSGFLVG